MIASFSLLNARELQALPPELTLFLFPVGGLEQHGPHLPLGTKLIEAEEWARAIANELKNKLPEWNFIYMPLIPLTTDSVTNRISLNVRPHVVRDAIVDQCDQLTRLGFQNYAVVSSHMTPRQLTALEDAANIVNKRKWFTRKRSQLISVTGAWIDSKTVFDSPMIALPKEHAGARETALMLQWNSKLVSPDYRGLPPVDPPKASVSRFFEFFKNEIDGYWGNPGEAHVEAVQTDFQNEVRMLAEKMLPWLMQGKGQGQFKSGYRIFPFNGSFFKAYILATIFFFTMLIWVIWSVKDVFQD